MITYLPTEECSNHNLSAYTRMKQLYLTCLQKNAAVVSYLPMTLGTPLVITSLEANRNKQRDNCVFAWFYTATERIRYYT